MGITEKTKEEFRSVLEEELGIVLTQGESDRILRDLVSYFGLLRRLSEQVKTSPDAQN